MPPELIFDAGFGELFIIRVAGNVVSPEVMGTLQYAGVHLRTPLFVVLGHEGCGAVAAALAARRGGREPARIALLLDNIVPGLHGLPPALAPDEEMRAAVEPTGAGRCISCVKRPKLQALVEGAMKLVGGVYDLEDACGFCRNSVFKGADVPFAVEKRFRLDIHQPCST